MKIKLNGVTRIVFVFDKFVIKIPNFRYCHQHFLQGCYANWSERSYCKTTKGNKSYNLVCPTYFCSWFGLIQIQAKCIELDRKLTRAERKLYVDSCFGDIKKENFGYYKNRLVILDYI